MKFYTVARKISQVYGHGDHGEEYHICPIDGYHTYSNKFHPIFTTKESAETYKDGLEFPYNIDIIIVELDVHQFNPETPLK